MNFTSMFNFFLVVLTTIISLQKISFADEDPMIEIGTESNSVVSFVPISEETISNETHSVEVISEKVIKVTEKTSGKTTIIGLSNDRKQAVLDILTSVEFMLGVRASAEFFKTVEIGVNAGMYNGFNYGAFANLHIIKFQAWETENDIYLGSHYRQRIGVATDCAILAECYGSLTGTYGDLRLGLRQSGLADNDRLFIAYEIGYGKFMGLGGKYKQKYDEYEPNGHRTGDTVAKKGLVIQVVIGYKLFSR